jgi:uncharacterized membrane-anchored protein
VLSESSGFTRLAVRVAPVTVIFWILKLLTTGVGESSSDYLASVSIPLAGAIGAIGFGAALIWQLRTGEYRPAPYWATVLMIAVFGTMLADGLHLVVGIPYAVTSIGYAIAVAAALIIWYATEKTVSIHEVNTLRREIFYWCTVAATFALGTAVGDLTAITLHLGYLDSAFLFGAAIGIVAIAWRAGLNSTVAFWSAYVLTRPLGASIADWIGKPKSKGGLGMGDGWVSVFGIAIIAVIVAVLARRATQSAPVLAMTTAFEPIQAAEAEG